MNPDETLSPDPSLSPAGETDALTPLDDAAASGEKSLALTPEQLDALGLVGCQPGDSYTIRVTKGEGDTFTVDGVDAPIDQGESAPLGDEPLDAAPEEDFGGGIPPRSTEPKPKHPMMSFDKLRNPAAL